MPDALGYPAHPIAPSSGMCTPCPVRHFCGAVSCWKWPWAVGWLLRGSGWEQMQRSMAQALLGKHWDRLCCPGLCKQP